jgi:hypothetical protein
VLLGLGSMLIGVPRAQAQSAPVQPDTRLEQALDTLERAAEQHNGVLIGRGYYDVVKDLGPLPRALYHYIDYTNPGRAPDGSVWGASGQYFAGDYESGGDGCFVPTHMTANGRLTLADLDNGAVDAAGRLAFSPHDLVQQDLDRLFARSSGDGAERYRAIAAAAQRVLTQSCAEEKSLSRTAPEGSSARYPAPTVLANAFPEESLERAIVETTNGHGAQMFAASVEELNMRRVAFRRAGYTNIPLPNESLQIADAQKQYYLLLEKRATEQALLLDIKAAF